MSRCIKTGAILDLSEDDRRELGCRQWYGDIHLVGTAIIGYYPAQRGGLVAEAFGKAHGSLQLPTNGLYFQKNTQPYRILVVPAHCIQWYDGALHEHDRTLFDRALRWSLRAGELQS